MIVVVATVDEDNHNNDNHNTTMKITAMIGLVTVEDNKQIQI